MNYVICNINIQIPVDDKLTVPEQWDKAMNYELPKEYIEDSFEIVKIVDENDKEVEE